jgi:fibronectin type 3 domain-containing protein
MLATMSTLSFHAPASPIRFPGAVIAPASGAGVPAPSLATVAAPPRLIAVSVPGSPTGVVGVPGDGRVNLTWSAPSRNGGSVITDYVIQMRSNAGATWTVFADGVSTATSATVTGLTNGTSYVFRVAAVNVAGTGAASPASTAITPLPVPGVPGGMTVVSATDSSATLSWTDVSWESEYRIERSSDYVEWYGGDDGTWTEVGRRAADTTTFTDVALEEGSRYSYRVIAVNAAGASAPSGIVTAETRLRAPDGVVATVVHGGRIDLSWVDRSSRETYYVVEQFDPWTNGWAAVGYPPAESSGMTVGGSFAPNTTFQLRVRAVAWSSWWAYTNAVSEDVTVSVTTPAYPTAPASMTAASATDSAITLSWDDVSGESGYRIERSSDYVEWYGSDYGTWTEVGRNAADTTTFTDAGLEEGSQYSYRVIAVNAAGASAPGDVVTTTTNLLAPTDVVATVIDGGRIDLTWTDRSSRESYYRVEQFVPEWNTWTWVSGTPLGSTGMIVSGSFLPSTTYQFRVRAESYSWWYGQGGSSDDVLASVNTPAYPSAPGEVTAIAFSDGVRLSWEFRPDVVVVVERMSGGGAWATVAEITSEASSYEDYDLEPSTAYAYRIAFRNAHGTSVFSATVSAVTTAGPYVSAAYRSPVVVFVGWTSPLEAATGIVIERATSGSDAWTAIASLAGSVTGYDDTTVVPGTSYRYRISFSRAGRPPLTAIGAETGPEPRDSDGDGLTDGDELAGGTNPKAFSSDDDMLGDGFELANGLNPLNSDENGNGVPDQHDDFDGDGLTNFQEMLYGTSTRRTDTDGDGLPDGVDTDGDGVSDGLEVAQGSDPTNPLDQGIPPEPEERIKLTLTVGDPSGSHSEQWALQVGAVTQESPDYGVVGSGVFSFDVGRSYPVTLRHRGSLYPDYPDYDWYANIEATDRSDFFVVDTNSPLYLVGPYQGDGMSGYGGDRFSSLAATLHIPRFDVDVDSNNDSGFTEPDDNREEDRLERDASRGKLVGVGGGRVPLAVRLSANVEKARPASTELYFDYDPKLFQLWKNAGSDRSPGNMIPAKTWVNAAEIGLTPDSRGLVYVEALEGASGAVPIKTSVKVQGSRWSGTLTDTVHLLPVELDLDVDSNNDGEIDPDNGPAGKDDRIEEESTRGLVVPVYAGDSDRDGHDDTRDFDGISTRRFSPVKVSLSSGAAWAWRRPIAVDGAPSEDLPGLMFTFTFSDAGFSPAPEGAFRLWKKNAPSVRTEEDLIRSGVPIPAAEFFAGQPFTNWDEYLSNYGTKTLYVEAVAPTEGYEPIVVSIGGTGAWANSTTTDTVHVRALETAIDLGVDSNNNEGFGVPERSPAAEKQWEEKLEDHSYALGKLVMQSSGYIGDTIGEDRLAASFTPVVVELPKNLPVDAKTIGVRFAMDDIGALSSGEIRLWTRNKGAGLLSQDAGGEPDPLVPWGVFGHRVYFDKPYTLSQINYDSTTGRAVLYMDGHVATRDVTLSAAEQRFLPNRGILEATLTFDAPDLRIPLAEDGVQYMVVRDDFFYHDLQFGSVGLRSTGSQVRSAMASRGVYSYSELPNFALKRLTTRTDQNGPPGELQDILKLDPNSDAVALLYNDADKPGNPTAYPGFKAVLYQDYAAVADNTFVLTFGGTDDQLGLAFNGEMPELADWVENIGQGLGWRIAQYRWAMQVAREVEFATRGVPGGATLTTAGHSLGGGLASAASVVTGATGVTFNAAGLHENSLRMYFENDPAELAVALARYQNPQGLVTAYTVDWDFLSNFQERLKLVVNRALGDRKELDGPHDFAAETIQAINAAFSAAGAVPGGALVKLGINLAAKAGTGYLMYRCHSMDVVLYGLLVKENLINDNRDLLGYPLSRFF